MDYRQKVILPPPVYKPDQKRTILRAPAPPVYQPSKSLISQRAMASRPAPPVFRVPDVRPGVSVRPPTVYRPSATAPSQKKEAPGVKPPPVYRPDLSVKRGPAARVAGHRPNSSPLQPRVMRTAVAQALPAREHIGAQRVTSGPVAQRGNTAIQRYETLSATRIFPREDAINIPKRRVAVIPGNEGNFIWQQKKKGGSFLGDTAEKANLVGAERVNLRVSDDWQMAIQDTNLSRRQPKVFYATETVFQNSKTKLSEVGSQIKLVKTSRVLTLWDGNSTRRQLTQLLPQSVQKPVKDALTLLLRQKCNDLAPVVTGSSNISMCPTSQELLGVKDVYTTVEMGGPAQIAAVVAALMKKSKGDRQEEFLAAENEEEQAKVTQEIAIEYVQALSDQSDRLDQVLRYLKINQYASPDVGDAFVIASVARSDKHGYLTDLQTDARFKPDWPYHFGGVVAKSGSDTVTLENYAREKEGISNMSDDPRWYFQMYGTGQGQSFHEANVALGGYANPVTTALHNEARSAKIIEQRRRERQRRELMRKAKVWIGRVSIPFLLFLVVLFVLYRHGYI